MSLSEEWQIPIGLQLQSWKRDSLHYPSLLYLVEWSITSRTNHDLELAWTLVRVWLQEPTSIHNSGFVQKRPEEGTVVLAYYKRLGEYCFIWLRFLWRILYIVFIQYLARTVETSVNCWFPYKDTFVVNYLSERQQYAVAVYPPNLATSLLLTCISPCNTIHPRWIQCCDNESESSWLFSLVFSSAP